MCILYFTTSITSLISQKQFFSYSFHPHHDALHPNPSFLPYSSWFSLIATLLLLLLYGSYVLNILSTSTLS
ncbi:hypothetical protein L873DRAFT_548507 [Choiromyces venosus 120613-1]|uniref:Uncharacterized protein n=1 Tax=Choiromyces venosus 120613-1 TaxID=1336337 RepID=A0A3N4K8N9_9PEZI|nr:hypothetical protein L873DRAFT_548507 [Choiromyces venosus 120613-1]